MSDSTNSNSNQANPALGKAADAAKATEAAVNQFQGKTLDQISAQEAKVLAEEAKASGKSIQEVFASKQGPAPKSNQDQIKDAAKEAMKKWKVKVDGQDLEVDENELVRGYSHQKAANKILQEGKTLRKQAEEFISMMKDPQKFYDTARKLGHDPRKLAEEYLASQLQDELMDPRDKELRDAKAKLKHIEDMERQQKEAVEKQRMEQLKAKFAEDYSKQFVSALEESGLPATKPMVAEMAKYISRSAKIGFKMTAQEAAQLVKEDIQNAHRKLIGDTDGETLIKLLGEDVANKVRKYDTSRLKDPNQNLRTPSKFEQLAPEDRRERGQPKKRMSAKEWREFNRKK